ncbi:DUF3693 domain-containing protein [Aeromonas enteropelogenes]|uniref:DUF3693 domain-containing protein n=1 Tax=Aeromonas enteropelogenes TaxID=29489 RepID=UPI003F7B24E4
MDSKTLLEAYMRAKNFTQFKEVAEELGFSGQYISQIKKGHLQVTDETAKKMAEEIGLDPAEVIISLHAVKAESPEMKAAWYDILKKYCASTGAALTVACMTMKVLSAEAALTASLTILC